MIDLKVTVRGARSSKSNVDSDLTNTPSPAVRTVDRNYNLVRLAITDKASYSQVHSMFKAAVAWKLPLALHLV